jgi:hypothetical protein
MRTALGLLIAMVASLVVGVSAEQRSAAGARGRAVTMFSLPASDSVYATIATNEGRLLLLVLWRGPHRWYRGNKRSHGGGSGTTFNSTESFKGGEVSFSFDTATRKATVQGRDVTMLPDKNVILVDGIDGADGGRVVSTLAIDASDLDINIRHGFPGLVPLLSRSPEMVDFLQCDAAQAVPPTVMPCAFLLKKLRPS